MEQPVTVYRWDDVGAPVLDAGKPSEIIDILTKCLVEGYGTKAPLGWTRPFYDDTNQAVAFRNSVAAGGSGGYVKIYSNDNTDNNNAVLRIVQAVTMTDIETLFRPGYTHAFRAQSGSGSNKMDKWALIGTATAFYFFISANNMLMSAPNYYNAVVFAGDVLCKIPNDSGRFITIANVSASGDSSSSDSFPNSMDYWSAAAPSPNQNTVKMYDADGADDFKNYRFYLSPLGGGTISSAGYSGEPTAEHVLQPAMVLMTSLTQFSSGLDRLGAVLSNSQVSPIFRGVLPGMFDSFVAGYRSNPWPTTISINGDNYWLLRNAQGGPCHVMIKLGVWDDPFSGS